MRKNKVLLLLLSLLVLCSVLLTGCSFNISIGIDTPKKTVEVYIPDETQTDVTLVPIEIELEDSMNDDKEDFVLEALQEYSLISEDTYLRGYTSVRFMEPKIKLNFSGSLLEDFNNSEYDSKVLMKCIVNSFWYNFEPSSLEITVDGEPIAVNGYTFESIYTSPM